MEIKNIVRRSVIGLTAASLLSIGGASLSLAARHGQATTPPSQSEQDKHTDRAAERERKVDRRKAKEQRDDAKRAHKRDRRADEKTPPPATTSPTPQS